ncbi:erythrocyte membrane protein 1 [Plasmodium falciparum IGH-CR14]|uniref:Erythrocyte membrane protein 1 n=1 Tax=Plasmodium falciparum IGH-CR14 TaxID=580059 RepID=A0A0L1I7X6_PLAFA|nr:erythrocyte membrane protein 1 [Plasmodium falciparum IGH-CR14]
MAPGRGGTDKSAKEVLDEFGQQVHEEVKNGGAEAYKDDLKGNLQKAVSTIPELAAFSDPCKLVEDYYKNPNGGGDRRERYPCTELSGKYVERFSDTLGGQCTNKKMRSDGIGACAPYRRLHLCHHNLENISDYDSNARHKLLLEVCMAAKYEGQSIKTYYPKHQLTNNDSASQLCTVLARSFADIGDIVRGKDLFYGNTQEKKKREQLDENLKKIFRNIYDKLDGKNGKTLQKRYQDATGNYFQLREDWWNNNREMVWYAITCGAAGGTYFRPTCGINDSWTGDDCRCAIHGVPTYFDYVPQYLRWFEEWAEDFCRKKNKKIKDVKRNCRGDNGTDRYCSRNGYDCEKTKRAVGKYRMGNQCTKCLYACNPYVEWIEKQKEEFDKQKNKYTDEINGTSRSSRRRRSAGGTTATKYEGYESKFYNKLKEGNYGKVDAFLGLLSKEKACTQITDEKEGTIHFEKVNSDSTSGGASASDTSGTNDKTKGTFYRSKYCQPCPICGVKKNNNGSGWEEKDKSEQCNIKLYEPKAGVEGTEIIILKSGENQKEIENKLNEFCAQANGDRTNSGGSGDSGTGGGAGGSGGNSEKKELIEKWQCYKGEDVQKVGEGEEDVDDLQYDQEVENAGGLCILENKNKKENKSSNEPAQFQKTYNDFFNFWVAHMLKDSIYWETQELKKCLKNEKKKCGNEKCEKSCKCFETWIKQKKEKEWDPIKTHFKKQKNLGGFTPDALLKSVLELEFSKDNSEESSEGNSENNVSAREIHLINKMLEEDEKEQEASVGGVVNEENTPIDKLLKHEKGIATKCKKCEDPPKPGVGGGAARSPSENDEDDMDDEDDDDDDDDDDDVPDVEAAEDGSKDDEATEDAADGTEQDTEGSEVPAATTEKKEEVKVCETVKKALTGDNNALNEACGLKYGPGGKEKFPNWKCIPSGDTTSGKAATTGSSGAICVPPRRRKLYVGKLHDWAEKTQLKTQVDGKAEGGGTGEQSSQQQEQEQEQEQEQQQQQQQQQQEQQPHSTGSSSSSPPSHSRAGDVAALRDAFIQSAAIETFFLWDRYKKENKTQNTSQLQPIIRTPPTDDDKDPQNKLLNGTIPNDFLRQMFYTLGDYRDICIGDDTMIKALEKSVYKDSSGEEKSKMTIIQLSKLIEQFLQNSGDNKESASVKPGPKPGGQTPQSWWDNNAEHIWKGMVCALTYDTDSGAKGTDGKIEQDPKVQQAFFGTPNDKPGLLPVTPVTAATPTGTQKGKFESTYDYTNVSFSGGFNSDKNAATITTRTTLIDFSRRPTFFRWLEEWADEFCRKRTHKLDIIEKECKVEANSVTRRKNGTKTPQCSCYGEDCKDNLRHDPSTIPSLDCPGCGKSCSSYRKWIERKKTQYEKQKEAYDGQKDKCVNGNNKDDKGFCGSVTTCDTAKEFLQKLGSCKNNEDGNNKPIFDDEGETFQHAKNCKPCSKFKVKCENGDCSKDKRSECTGNNKMDITADRIKDPTENIGMLVSDESTAGFCDLDDCADAGIFKGIRKDVWTCGNVCGYNVCKPENVNGEGNNENQIILITALVKRWLEYFLEDYNKIRKKLNLCVKNRKDPKCIKYCVDTWINEKSKEWQQITGRLNEQYKNKEEDVYPVKTILEELIPKIDVTIDKRKVTELSDLERSLGCNCADNSQKKNTHERDIVKCLLDKLEKLGKKATSCPGKTSDKTQPNCDENTTPQPDEEEELLEETEENPVEQPNICPTVDTPSQPENEGDCNPAPAPSDDQSEKTPPAPAPAEPAQDTESETKSKEEKTSEAKPPSPPEPAPEELPSPPLAPLVTSTLAWSVGIGFAAFTYFYLKKKTKSSVGNLFQILQIPKGDHDIPTLKSKNRYIPYRSGSYKGKTYIYMEGDSSGDEKYAFMSDTTDVTSSESEYEEMDINDIYVPGSPKYKTLIEVVLEPSGNNTTASGNNTTASGKNTPTSNIPSDNTPTPPPITDDEWNTLKHEFISQYLQSEQPKDVPNDYKSGNSSTNTNITTTSHHNVEEKPFIMSIHDRDLYTGEEYNYDMFNSGNNPINISDSTNSMDSLTSNNHSPYNDKNDLYSGIDLINDALSGNQHIDIYDEMLKRKENELFGTNHVKQTSIHSVAKLTNSDPIHNQLELFHTWLDRHRDMCEKWENHHERLPKLKELWENETHSGNTHPSDSNKTLNTDVSIQIDMNNPKPINEFTNMDTILEDLEKYNEPYYDVQDDIYYDVHDHDASTVDTNAMDIPSKVQIEMDVNTKLVKEKYPISDVWV